MKTEVKESIKKILVICFASFLMALNIKSFVRTGGLYPGGATGLALLIQRAADMFLHITIPYTIVNILLNAIPVYIGFRFIGKKFTMYSCLMIVLTSVLTDIIPGYAITYDTLLISIFGGLINGLVIGLCLHMNATTGGTDFIAIYLSDKKGVDSFNIVLGLAVSNGLVALSGALLSQYQGFADVGMGRGAIVIGLAAVIIGEALFSRIFHNFALKMVSVSLGAIIYYIVIQLVLTLGFDANLLKLLSASVVAIFLAVPYWKGKYFSKPVKKAKEDAKNA